MKRAISLMLALLLATLPACLAEAAEACLGVWYMNEAVYGGQRMSPDVLGAELTLTLNADGTATQETNGNAAAATWRAEGGAVILDDGSTAMTLTLEGDTLWAESETGVRMRFDRERTGAEAFETAALEAVTRADFIGAWEARSVSMNGSLIPVMLIGSAQTLTITEARILLTEGTSAPVEVEGELAGNALLLTDPDGSGVPMELRLHEDGVLSARMTSAGMTVTIYFDPARE